MVTIGDTVKWSRGRKPLGVVIHKFWHKGKEYAVVEKDPEQMQLVRIYEELIVVEKGPARMIAHQSPSNSQRSTSDFFKKEN